jgi:hypothetical protein
MRYQLPMRNERLWKEEKKKKKKKKKRKKAM